MKLTLDDKISLLFACADILDYPDDIFIIQEVSNSILSTNAMILDIDEIQAEYIRIFLINATLFKCVPYASWWIDGKMCGSTLSKIDKFYIQCGYKFDKKKMKKPADHISFMIRFVAILAQERRFSDIVEFSNFLTWFNDFTNSVSKVTNLQLFPSIIESSHTIINSFKEDA